MFCVDKNNLSSSVMLSIVSKASALILPADDKHITQIVIQLSLNWILVKDPKIAFAETLEFLYPSEIEKEGIHQTAVIGENVKIGPRVSIGANV